MRKNRVLFSILIFFLGIISFDILAAEVRKDHPRIWVTKERLKDIREWCKNPLKEQWDLIKGDKRLEAVAFSYLILNDESYAKRAIEMMKSAKTPDRPGPLEEISRAFDWCYNSSSFSEKDKKEIIAKIEAGADVVKAGYGSHWSGRLRSAIHNVVQARPAGVGIAGYALDGHSDKAKDYIAWAAEWFGDSEKCLTVFPDGDYDQGMDYTRHYTRHLLRYYEARLSATGESYEKIDFLKNHSNFILFMTQPDDTFARYSDNDYPTLGSWHDRQLIVVLANRFKDSYAKWFYQTKLPEYTLLTNIMEITTCDDPYLKPKRPDPSCYPMAKLFRGNSIVVMRTGFEPDDLYIWFHGGGTYCCSHDHCDYGSFNIYKNGDLAIDSGLYGDQYGKHHDCYYRRAISHNTINIFDPKGGWDPGGQRYMEHSWSSWQAYQKSKDGIDMGKVKRFKSTKEYDYALGDITKAYVPEKLSNFTRQILLIKPEEFIVIFDRVSTPKPELEKVWLLHTIDEPEVNGKEIQKGPGFTTFDGDMTKITEGNGVFYCRSFLPNKCSITKRGGPGFEFWVFDENIMHNSNFTDPACKPGNWRIEVKPSISQKDDIFLHLLYPNDDPLTEVIKKSTLIESDKLVGLEIGSKLVLFSKLEKEIEEGSFSVDFKKEINIFICDLVPNLIYKVSVDGTISQANSNKAGIITFKLGSGKHNVSLKKTEAEVVDKTPDSFIDPDYFKDAPQITGVKVLNLTSYSVTISWATSKEASGQVEYIDIDKEVFMDKSEILRATKWNTTKIQADLKKEFQEIITGLMPEKKYRFRIKCRDVKRKLYASEIDTFITPKDTTPPVISQVSISKVYSVSAGINFQTDDPSICEIEYGPITQYGFIYSGSKDFKIKHSLTVFSLKPLTTYHCRVKAKNTSGEIGMSKDLTFTTQKAGKGDLFEDFESSTLRDWKPFTPNYWEIKDYEGSKVYFLKDTDRSDTEISLYEGADYSDFTFQCKARTVEGGKNTFRDYFIVFGYQDKDNYYLAWMSGAIDPNDAPGIIKKEKGKITRISDYPDRSITIQDTGWHNLELTRKGEKIVLKVDGKTFFEAKDKTFGRGKIGIGSYNDSAMFDNIEITEVVYE